MHASRQALAVQSRPHALATVDRVLHALELLSLVSAAALVAQAAVLQRQSEQQVLVVREQGHWLRGRTTKQYMVQAPPMAPMQSPSVVTNLAIAGLAVALLLGKGLQLLRHFRMAPAEGQLPPGSSALARVARLEAVSAQQAERADQTGRQLEKLQLRSRLMGRDLRPVLRQVQMENRQQADQLANLSTRADMLQQDIEDNHNLMAALQGVTAKQFDLLVRSMQQVRRTASASDTPKEQG